MNLYLVVLGGRIYGGHVEIHDVRWVIGETIESAIPNLKTEWIGKASGLHIDSYKAIRFVDGYKVKLMNKNNAPREGGNKLWFVNFGGYKTDELLEQHHLELAVAPSIQVAKKKARNKWPEPMNQIHKDDHAAILQLREYSVILEPGSQMRNDGMSPDWSGYWILD